MPDDRSPILLVDDNPKILETTATYLRTRGLEVVTADSPLGVSAIVRKVRPAIIVLDVMMPALDGTSLARLLASQGLGRSTPIIFYSALDEEQLYARTLEIPNASYVPKAEGLAVLLEAIRRKSDAGRRSRAGSRA